jgi:hypothetical protein
MQVADLSQNHGDVLLYRARWKAPRSFARRLATIAQSAIRNPQSARRAGGRGERNRLVAVLALQKSSLSNAHEIRDSRQFLGIF